jgi:Ethanolamine utilization protein EutJ (predicted chaperonin)
VRILRNLNSPVAVLVVLALFLVVNGFLLYRYQQSLQTAESDVGTPLVEEATSSLQGPPTTAKTATALEMGSTVAEETTAKETTSSQAAKRASEVRAAVSVTAGTTGLSIFEDGQLAFDQAVVEPGFSREFEAEEEITISAFDAGAVQIVVNGRDLGPLGESGEGVTRTFTAGTL